MSQSLHRVIVHLVFSTFDRTPFIHESVQDPLHRYLSGTLSGLGCHAIRVGGVEDHVHLLFGLSRTLTIAKTVERVKTSSSVWIKTQGAQYREFGWQGGYGIFSVSEAHVPRVDAYIARQKEHHLGQTFQEELIALLKEHGIEYDDRYLWV